MINLNDLVLSLFLFRSFTCTVRSLFHDLLDRVGGVWGFVQNLTSMVKERRCTGGGGSWKLDNFHGRYTCIVSNQTYIPINLSRHYSNLKGATKSYFMHYMLVITILFNTGLYESAISTNSFAKLLFLCFIWLSVYSVFSILMSSLQNFIAIIYFTKAIRKFVKTWNWYNKN